MSDPERPEHQWQPIQLLGTLTSHGWAPPGSRLYHCFDCGHYARTDDTPGPCPPPDDSPRLLESN